MSIDRNYQSEMDLFLQEFDKRPEATSVNRKAEEEKYQKLNQLRDNNQQATIDGNNRTKQDNQAVLSAGILPTSRCHLPQQHPSLPRDIDPHTIPYAVYKDLATVKYGIGPSFFPYFRDL